jgi:hypothetical protein
MLREPLAPSASGVTTSADRCIAWLDVTMTLRAMVRDGARAQVFNTASELEDPLVDAERQARSAGLPGGIKLQATNGDELLLVVGGSETVIGSGYGHRSPPYIASLGPTDTDFPLLTAHIALAHHTEFSRRHLVPMEVGRQAARDLMRTGRRPVTVRWGET